MMTPDTDQDNYRVETNDMWAIICLRIDGHVPVEIYTVPNKHDTARFKVIYVFEGKEAHDLLDSWIRSEPYPIMALQDVRDAYQEFKSNVHHYTQQAEKQARK